MTEYVRLCKLILCFFMIFLISPHSYLSCFRRTSSQHASVRRPTHLVMNIYQPSSIVRTLGTTSGRPINMKKVNYQSKNQGHYQFIILCTRFGLLSYKDRVKRERDKGVGYHCRRGEACLDTWWNELPFHWTPQTWSRQDTWILGRTAENRWVNKNQIHTKHIWNK